MQIYVMHTIHLGGQVFAAIADLIHDVFSMSDTFIDDVLGMDD